MVRGDIHVINLSTAVGHEQRGRRYAVVVQSTALLLSSAIICPTSTSARATSFRPEVDVDGGATLVMCDQLQAVDVTRLGEIVGHVSHDEMRDIEEAIRYALDVAWTAPTNRTGERQDTCCGGKGPTPVSEGGLEPD